VTDPLVVHLLPETADAGAENQARYLLQGLVERAGWQLELAYFRPGRAHERFTRLGVPLHRIPQRRALPLDLYPRVRALRALYRDRRPAILHTWLYEANIVGAVAARAWPATRLLVTQRSGRLEESTPHVQRSAWIIKRRADQAVANSREGLVRLRGLGFAADRISLIRNGFPSASRPCPPSPTARLESRARLGLDADVPIIGYIGRVHPAKDLPTLFAAMAFVWAKLPDARLVMVGPSAADLKAVDVVRPDRVHLTGWHAQPSQLAAGFDVLASSSWTEGHSNSVCETLLEGVPVACTATGDHIEVVRAAGGQVVAIRDPEALAVALLALLHDPPDQARTAARAAELLSMAPVLDATNAIYARLIGSS
jgi:glycosyltransferase involved in cell wall biosynthesis